MTFSLRKWRPRCCLGCGRELEKWTDPWSPGAYRVCEPCGILYVAGDVGDTFERVELEDVPPEFAALVEQLFASYWRAATPPTFNEPLGRAAA